MPERYDKSVFKARNIHPQTAVLTLTYKSSMKTKSKDLPFK